MAASGMIAGARPATGTRATAGTSLEKRCAGSRRVSRPASEQMAMSSSRHSSWQRVKLVPGRCVAAPTSAPVVSTCTRMDSYTYCTSRLLDTDHATDGPSKAVLTRNSYLRVPLLYGTPVSRKQGSEKSNFQWYCLCGQNVPWTKCSSPLFGVLCTCCTDLPLASIIYLFCCFVHVYSYPASHSARFNQSRLFVLIYQSHRNFPWIVRARSSGTGLRHQRERGRIGGGHS